MSEVTSIEEFCSHEDNPWLFLRRGMKRRRAQKHHTADEGQRRNAGNTYSFCLPICALR